MRKNYLKLIETLNQTKFLILTIAILAMAFQVNAQTTIATYTFDSDVDGWEAGTDQTVTYVADTFFTTSGSIRMKGLLNKVIKTNITLDGAGDYTLTYKAMGAGVSTPNIRANYKIGTTTTNLSTITLDGTETGADGNNWTNVTETFTLTFEEADQGVQIQLQAKSDDAIYYFDDIVLIKEPCNGFAVTAATVGGGANVITTPLP